MTATSDEHLLRLALGRDLCVRGVVDPFCPDEHVITESTDRRLLWHIEGFLAVSGTNDAQRDLGVSLRRYLAVTCEHHWHDWQGDDLYPAHRQCLWCNVVEDPDQSRSSSLPASVVGLVGGET